MGSPRNFLFSRGQCFDYLDMQFVRPLGNCPRIDYTQRVQNPQRLEPLTAEHLSMTVSRIQEWVGTDYYRRYTSVFQGHRVVHTARGAGSSIRDTGDNKVTFRDQVIYYVISSRTRINVFIDFNPIPELKVLVH